MFSWTVIRAWLATVPPGRVVALMTPPLAIAAGWLAALAARYLPGMPGLTKDQILAFAVMAALAVVTQAINWLRGNSQWERQVHAVKHGVGVGGSDLDHPALTDIAPDDAEPAPDDLSSERAKREEERLKRD